MAYEEPSPLISKNNLLLVTDDGPPHMIQKTNSGIDIDITKEVLISLGYHLSIEFSPLKRNMQQVISKQADLFVPTFYQHDSDNLFISDPIIDYKPTVFALKKHQYRFEHLLDIKALRVITFQGAIGYFGDSFEKMAKQNQYREIHDMSKLSDILIAERADVIILDYYIFNYFLNKKHKQRPLISAYPLIPPVKAHVGFNNKELRNKFNKQLSQYKKLNKDQLVIDRYISSSIN